MRGDRLKQRAELREMLLEAASGRAAAGFAEDFDPIPWWHIVARRIWDQFPDRRTLTGYLMGDPIYERSALGQGRQAQRQWVRDASSYFVARTNLRDRAGLGRKRQLARMRK